MQKKYTKNTNGGGRRATIESMRKDLMLFFFFGLFCKKKRDGRMEYGDQLLYLSRLWTSLSMCTVVQNFYSIVYVPNSR